METAERPPRVPTCPEPVVCIGTAAPPACPHAFIRPCMRHTPAVVALSSSTHPLSIVQRGRILRVPNHEPRQHHRVRANVLHTTGPPSAYASTLGPSVNTTACFLCRGPNLFCQPIRFIEVIAAGLIGPEDSPSGSRFGAARSRDADNLPQPMPWWSHEGQTRPGAPGAMRPVPLRSKGQKASGQPSTDSRACPSTRRVDRWSMVVPRDGLPRGDLGRPSQRCRRPDALVFPPSTVGFRYITKLHVGANGTEVKLRGGCCSNHTMPGLAGDCFRSDMAEDSMSRGCNATPTSGRGGREARDISGVQLNTDAAFPCTASGKRPQPYQPRVVVSTGLAGHPKRGTQRSCIRQQVNRCRQVRANPYHHLRLESPSSSSFIHRLPTAVSPTAAGTCTTAQTPILPPSEPRSRP